MDNSELQSDQESESWGPLEVNGSSINSNMENDIQLDENDSGLFEIEPSLLLNNQMHFLNPICSLDDLPQDECEDNDFPPSEKVPFRIIEFYYVHSSSLNEIQLSRKSFTYVQRNILKKWLNNHEENPYPTPEEYSALMSETQLTKKQIMVWLTNNRARYLGRSPKNGTTNLPANLKSDPFRPKIKI